MEKSAFTFNAIGTAWRIDFESGLPEEARSVLLARIQKRIDEFDKNYSRFRADSLVTEMSRKESAYTLPHDAEPMFSLYEKLYRLTDGLFTPLIGQLVSDAGYDAEYSLIPKKLSSPPAWDDALVYRSPELIVKKPVLLDFGAAGKGYLIDIVGDILKNEGIRSFSIDAGSDILYSNPNNTPFRVGLEDPADFSRVVGVMEIKNGSICASAGSRRKWAHFHHIMNPHLLSSPEHILGTWAHAETALLADALASCLFFVEPKILAEKFNFSYAILSADRRLEVSPNFTGEIFSKAM